MTAVPRLPWTTRLSMLGRLFAVQGAYNYETMVGNGIAFALEPALRLLPGGRGGEAYRQAMARQAAYFNAHPYLTSVAVGALARAELSGEPPERIERFRTASCGPLGSAGDRLVWAAWLPACSLLGLVAFGLGFSPKVVVAVFLITYNVGHVALRIWGLRTGFRHGLGVASALATPLLRVGPARTARVAAFLAGAALPLTAQAIIGPARSGIIGVAVVALAGGALFAKLQGRVQGWRVAIPVLAVLVIVAVML